jgi:RNA recognition motif-containing protein
MICSVPRLPKSDCLNFLETAHFGLPSTGSANFQPVSRFPVEVPELRTGGASKGIGRIKMKSLFVGNMNFQTTESDLRTLFEPFGQVTRVHMAMDRETGRARGFAFIEMPNDDEAAKAMAGLDGKELGGRNLKVNEARPKGEGGPPRGPRTFGGPNAGRGPSSGRDGGGSRDGGGRGKGSGGGRDRFSNEDYRESARQPREPRW